MRVKSDLDSPGEAPAPWTNGSGQTIQMSQSFRKRISVLMRKYLQGLPAKDMVTQTSAKNQRKSILHVGWPDRSHFPATPTGPQSASPTVVDDQDVGLQKLEKL